MGELHKVLQHVTDAAPGRDGITVRMTKMWFSESSEDLIDIVNHYNYFLIGLCLTVSPYLSNQY